MTPKYKMSIQVIQHEVMKLGCYVMCKNLMQKSKIIIKKNKTRQDKIKHLKLNYK